MERVQYIIDRLNEIDKKYDDKLDRILRQTTLTNGRVTTLEDKINKADIKVNGLEDCLSKVNDAANINRGRDKTIWIVCGVVGAVLIVVIEHFISKT